MQKYDLENLLQGSRV